MRTTRKRPPAPAPAPPSSADELDEPLPAASEYVAIMRDSFEHAIALLDAKAGVLLAFSGAVFIFTVDTLGKVIDSHHGAHPRVFVAALLTLGLGAVALLATTVLCWTVIKPRIKTTGSRFFWKSDFFDGAPEAFRARMRATTADEFEKDAIIDAHNLASICRAKNARFGLAARSGEAALVLFLVGLLLWQVLKVSGG